MPLVGRGWRARVATGVLPLLLGACSSGVAPLAQATQPFAGTVIATHGQQVVVRRDEATDSTVTLARDTKVLEVRSATLAEIAANSFVGAAATVGADGALTATEVHLFDERLRGIGEGHRLLPAGDQSSMTNGVAEASMTNGTVATGQSGTGLLLTLRYKGGEQRIRVPGGATVTFVAPGNAALLVPGAHVVIVPGASATGAPAIVKVGKAGFAPSP